VEDTATDRRSARSPIKLPSREENDPNASKHGRLLSG